MGGCICVVYVANNCCELCPDLHSWLSVDSFPTPGLYTPARCSFPMAPFSLKLKSDHTDGA